MHSESFPRQLLSPQAEGVSILVRLEVAVDHGAGVAEVQLPTPLHLCGLIYVRGDFSSPIIYRMTNRGWNPISK